MSSILSRRPWLPIAIIILLAIGMRLLNLSVRTLWYDEAFAVLFAEKGLSAMLYGTLTPVTGGAADIHPILYYTLLNGWMSIVGQSPVAVRLFSVVLGVVTVVLIYGLAKTLFDEKTGLAAALINAIAPFHIQYSQETRMYALLGLLLTGATWCLVKAWRSERGSPQRFIRRWGYWVGFGVLAGLAMYTQQLAAFYLVALGCVPVISRRRYLVVGVAIGTLTAIVVYLPWLVNLPGQLQKVQSYYWLDKPSIATPLLTIRSFLTANMDMPSPASMVAFFGALFIILLLCVQTMMFVQHPRTRSQRKPLLFILWLAGCPPTLMWLVSQAQPVYLERSLLPSALMLYIALAWLLTRSGMPTAIKGVIGVVGLILVGIGLYFNYTLATFPNSPFENAGKYVAANWQAGDVIVHQNKLTALPVIYYQRQLPQYFIGDKAGSSDDTLALPTQETLGVLADECVQSAAHVGQRVWWIVFDFAAQQYEAAGRSELVEAEAWLNSHYSLDSLESFNDLNVILYNNPHGDLSPECAAS